MAFWSKGSRDAPSSGATSEPTDSDYTLLEKDSLVALAESFIPGITAQQPGILAEYQNEAEKMLKLWGFRCERYGDFLALFVDDGGGSRTCAVNLNTVDQIQLKLGRLPDIEGCGFIKVENITRYPTEGSVTCRIIQEDGWREGNTTVLVDRVDLASYLAPRLYSLGSASTVCYRNLVRLTGLARPLQRDCIIFSAENKVYTPPGHGSIVYNAILKEIGSKY
jgi:hypothetical protein